MITGKDIQFFWVARMVMMCSHLIKNSIPFPTTILHPLIRYIFIIIFSIFLKVGVMVKKCLNLLVI